MLPTLPPHPEPATVLARLEVLRDAATWEASGDRTVLMAIAGDYHLCAQRLFGKTEVSVVCGDWRMVVTLPGYTLEEARLRLVNELVATVHAMLTETTAQFAHVPEHTRTIEGQLEAMKRPRRSRKIPVPWDEMGVNEPFTVNIPEDMTPKRAYNNLKCYAHYRNKKSGPTDSRLFMVTKTEDEITVTRIR